MRELPHRIATKIRRHANSGCWEWTACKTRLGYGRVSAQGKTVWAHRLVYELLVGPIPDGRMLDHLCRVPSCVNPEHLEPVTNRQNTVRGEGPNVTRQRHRAQTECRNGHALAGENLYRHPSGQRCCRTCRLGSYRRYNANRRRADQLAGETA